MEKTSAEARGQKNHGIVALVLAAGTSSRLGRPKQLLELDGKPVLQHVVDLASECFEDVIVVLGHEAEKVSAALRLQEGVRVVVNRRYGEGQSTSLRAGLAAVPESADGVAVMLGDQPRLRPDVVRRVGEAFSASAKPVARPRFRGVPGHPVVIARRAFNAAATVEGDAGVRRIFGHDDVEEVEFDEDAPVDVDTWEAYERLRRA